MPNKYEIAPLPQFQAPRPIDFSGITGALDSIDAQRRHQDQLKLKRDELALARNRDKRDEDRFSVEKEDRFNLQAARVGQSILDAPAELRPQLLQQFTAHDPRIGAALSKGLPAGLHNDPDVVAKYLVAAGGLRKDPLEVKAKEAEIQSTQARTLGSIGQEDRAAKGFPVEQRTKTAQAQAAEMNLEQAKTQTPAWREANAERFGFQKGTQRYFNWVRTGDPGKFEHLKEGDSIVEMVYDPATGKTTGNPIVTAPNKVDATTKKAIDEADDFVFQNQTALGILKKARDINTKAYDGLTAGGRATIMNNLPFVDKEGSNATVELDNLITNQALQSLRSTFGGNPTEGERKILLDVAGSVNLPANIRENIYARAQQAVEERLRFNQQKAKNLRGDTYYKPGGEPAQLANPPAPATPPAGAPPPGMTVGPSQALTRIQSDADYDKLQKGERYVDPTGRIRTKQ